MSNDIDATAFGLPTGVNSDGDAPGAGFMYADDDLGVDENDPIYQATKAAWERENGSVPPKPGEDERPPEMTVEPDADADEGDEPPVDDTPPAEDPPAAEPPPAAGEQTDEAGTNDAAGSAPPASELAFQVDGQDFTLNTEQAEYLLRVNSWLESVPEETKQQWSGIEQGTHVAITAEEYKALQQAAQNPQPQRQPQAPDLDDLDADTIEYIKSLEARAQPVQQGGQPDNAPSQPDANEIAAAARHQAEQQQRMMGELAETNTKVRDQYQLTDEQLERLEQVTANLQVIPRLSQQMTQYSPTGQIIRQAPFGEVVERAYEIAMSQDPTLRQIRDDVIYNQRMAADAERNAATNSKKAKAGTLASAPSAAVPANGKGPQVSADNKMDLQATSAAIADALSKMSEQS